MKRKDLIAKIADSHERYQWQEDKTGILIRDAKFETITHFTFAALRRLTFKQIQAACVQGKDVDHVSRVTGYFSKISQWNKGKQAELKDRHRVTVGGDDDGVR